MVATMRDDDGAAVVGLGLYEKNTVSRAAYCMKPRPMVEKPPPWNSYSNSIALDRLVEVALSATDSLDLSCRGNVATPDHQSSHMGNDKSLTPRSDGEGGMNKDDDSAEKLIKGTKQAAMAPSPSSEPNNHQPAGYFHQQQKLKRRLSSSCEISQPAGRRSSSLRVHADHPHSKRFTPRFKSLVDISC